MFQKPLLSFVSVLVFGLLWSQVPVHAGSRINPPEIMVRETVDKGDGTVTVRQPRYLYRTGSDTRSVGVDVVESNQGFFLPYKRPWVYIALFYDWDPVIEYPQISEKDPNSHAVCKLLGYDKAIPEHTVAKPARRRTESLAQLNADGSFKFIQTPGIVVMRTASNCALNDQDACEDEYKKIEEVTCLVKRLGE